jgi:pyruvate/2-oxoglutarate dehydrogenase complex dihydrolipoamide dehydrogenase (E3) component
VAIVVLSSRRKGEVSAVEALLRVMSNKEWLLCHQSITVRLHTSEGERTLDASDLLVAVGRVPNTQGIGLGKTGVEVDEHGISA